MICNKAKKHSNQNPKKCGLSDQTISQVDNLFVNIRASSEFLRIQGDVSSKSKQNCEFKSVLKEQTEPPPLRS